jgi:hypothetical protein
MTVEITVEDMVGEVIDDAVADKESSKPERIPVCIKSAEVAIECARGQTPANVALKSVGETALPKIRRVGRN